MNATPYDNESIVACFECHNADPGDKRISFFSHANVVMMSKESWYAIEAEIDELQNHLVQAGLAKNDDENGFKLIK